MLPRDTSGWLDGLHLLQELAGADLFELLFFLVAFELPRYLLGVLAILAITLRIRSRDSAPGYSGNPDDCPAFTVIVAGHNEASALPKCLDSILEQTVLRGANGRAKVQVIAVDDGSTDRTAAVIAELQHQGRIDVGLSLPVRGGKSAATNLALTRCRHEFILVVDADTTFHRDAFGHMLAPFRDPRVGAVGGNLFVRNPRASLITAFQDIEYRISISLGRRTSDLLNVLGIVSGAFGAFRRSALASVGDFDMEVGEDADATMKLRAAGWRITFAPKAWAGTDVPETLTNLVRQRLRWDRSTVTIWARKYAGLLNPFRANFRLSDAMVVWDVLFAQVFLSVGFVLYFGWLLWSLGSMAVAITGATLIIYFILASVMLLVQSYVDDQPEAVRLLPYVPYYILLNFVVMRFVRVYSAINEWVFKKSYHDTYVPRHVSREVENY